MTNQNDIAGVTTPLLDPKAIGVEVSWSFGYGDAEAVCIDRLTVRSVLTDNGIDYTVARGLIPDFGADDSLKRALRYAPKKGHIAIKEFARPNKDTPRAVGIYTRATVEGESGDDWECAARVRFDAGTIACLPPEGKSFPVKTTEAMRIGRRMARQANSAMANVMNIDISTALTAIGESFGWISRRRNSGGVYFLPADTDRSRARAEQFVAILNELEQCSQSTGPGVDARSRQFIPQAHDLFPSPMTMKSWQGSAQDAFAADIEQLQKELGRMAADGKMRDKTKAERAAHADEIIAKAKTYRSFLGDAVDNISSQLETIQAAFIAAIGESEAEAAASFDAIDATIAATEAAPTPAVPAPAAPRGRRVIQDDDLFC